LRAICRPARLFAGQYPSAFGERIEPIFSEEFAAGAEAPDFESFAGAIEHDLERPTAAQLTW
jgi:hypothetical protein